MFFKKANNANFTDIERPKSAVKFLVIHYDAGSKATARNNLDFFARERTGTSAHYFVDEKEICCSVPWFYPAWHCGTKKTYKHARCRNSNSIGVEMCSRKDSGGDYYIPTETIKRTAEFVARLMKDYQIPIENVLRHYDVTGKICPEPFVPESVWANFKKLVMKYYRGETEETEMVYYETMEQVPIGEMREIVQKLVEKGTIRGTNTGLHISEDLARTLVFLHREKVI